MDYAIAVFTIRTQTIMFYKILISNGVRCEVIETPKQAHLACGISVKFLEKDILRVKKFMSGNLNSFCGYYKILYLHNKVVVVPLK
jgi:hypothetical protein